MAGLRPYEDFDWFDNQGQGIGMADIITQDRINSEPSPEPPKVTYDAPFVQRGGALDSSFSDFRMTPESPSVKESAHWKYYEQAVQNYSDAEAENAQEVEGDLSNPAGKLAYSTAQYKREGFEPRPMPKMDPRLTANAISEQEGKQVMFDMNKIPKWNESKSFGAGLLSFGLNLLAGNDIATAFNQGAQHFQNSFGREKRELWAQDLANQGYDAQEILSWVETGDQKALTNPMKKKMEIQAFRLGQAQLQKAEFENSPEYLEWKAEQEFNKEARAQRQLELQELSTLSNIEANQQATSLAERKFSYEKQKDLDSSGKPGKVAPRDALLAAQQLAVDLDLANQPIPTGGGVGASLLRNVAGEEIGSHLLTSPDAAQRFPDVYKANQIRVAQNQFTENGIRLATGAVVRPAEQEMFRNYLFPQGKDFDNPAIVARKRATQDVVNTIARNVAMGQAAAFDPAHMMKIAEAVSTGKANVLKRGGMVVGLQYRDGSVLQF